jgi:hypothetical protein
MAKEVKYKSTLNDIDKMWIERNSSMTPQQIVNKFIQCYGGDKVPSLETVTSYREKYLSSSGVTTTKANSPILAKKGTATVMTQGHSELDDSHNKSRINKQPPWVTKIFQDN